ncbi:MAG: succinate dehydrogenase/fumarate reductase iron-sulfur subunit [Sporomusaceae bacterium]|nr:succinate dehydrogenase/fumarate reductase iron-sulfur subunit [Sporomusaceae bacterium]
MRQITYKIHRFQDNKSFVQEYSFPHEPGKTILWGLIKIKDTMDPTLTFVAACRSAVCGACAVRVNGQAMLACEVGLDDVTARFGDTLEISPIQNFKVIRDLVVDWEPKAQRLKEVKPWLIPDEQFTAKSGCRQSPEDFKKIRQQADCILCGSCASECNKLSADERDFLEPFIFSKAQKFVADSRDKDFMAHLTPAMAKGLWKCVHCQECVTKCPKHLEPAEDISKLRQKSVQAGMTDNMGARHGMAFRDDIAKTGRLNEATMSVKTEGLLKSSTRAAFAMRLFVRGKLNPLHLIHSATPVQGIDKVRAIMKAVKEAEKE